MSSSTYLKRFSNMLSVTVLVPSAIPKSTAICGCISVGKPGYGSVVTCVCFKCPSDITLTESSNSSTWQPTSNSFAVVASRCFGMTSFTSTLPPVAATANMNVPASIWSGMTEYSVACNFSTPTILMTSVPAPLIFAPMLFKKFATSTTWGSLAAFSITVLPSAMAAAIIILIVAPTETLSIYMCVPLSSFALAMTRPWAMSMSAPMERKPFIWRSIGLLPISQPPGSATSACLYFPSNAPIK